MEKMEQNDINSKTLLDTIKKELSSIVNSSPEISAANVSKEKKNTARRQVKLSTTQPARNMAMTSKVNIPESERTKNNENKKQQAVSRAASFWEVKAMQNADEDLQKMQLQLQKSYELFHAIADKFETINFSRLRNRIKDLHIETNNSPRTKVAITNLKELFENSYRNNELNQLTDTFNENIRKHPREFGDIPEINAFYQACSQLQNGLQQLKRQRRETQCLTDCLSFATNAAESRVEEIKKTLSENII